MCLLQGIIVELYLIFNRRHVSALRKSNLTCHFENRSTFLERQHQSIGWHVVLADSLQEHAIIVALAAQCSALSGLVLLTSAFHIGVTKLGQIQLAALSDESLSFLLTVKTSPWD